jgi:tight adherence protein C
MGHLFFFLASGIAIFSAVGLLLMPLLSEPSPETQRILEAAEQTKQIRHVTRTSSLIEDQLVRLSRTLQSVLGLKRSPVLQARLGKAGIRGKDAADYFFAAQFLTPLLAAFAASFIASNTMFMILLLASLGYILPDMWLRRRISLWKKRIQRGMPDALDLLVICVDAGMGLDQALLRVNDELKFSHPAIYEEFLQVNLEQRAGRPRLESWQNLTTRTEAPELAGFVSMLVQTERFGTPILKALRDFAEEIRDKRQQRAEEAAAKTKIKIVFPLVLCIFPCIFVVLLAPALIGILASLKNIGN